MATKKHLAPFDADDLLEKINEESLQGKNDEITRFKQERGRAHEMLILASGLDAGKIMRILGNAGTIIDRAIDAESEFYSVLLKGARRSGEIFAASFCFSNGAPAIVVASRSSMSFGMLEADHDATVDKAIEAIKKEISIGWYTRVNDLFDENQLKWTKNHWIYARNYVFLVDALASVDCSSKKTGRVRFPSELELVRYEPRGRKR